MRQCCEGFYTGSFEKSKYAIFLDHFCAPFTLLALLACATAYGSAFAQTTAGSVSQQSSQSDSKVPGNISSLQVSGGGYLGVYLGDITAERAKELSLKETRGAVVGRVEEDSPAAKVGLQENDVILAFNAERVQNRAHFHHLITGAHPGSKVSLGISRRGADQRLEVVLGQSRSAALDAWQKLFREPNVVLAQAEETHKQAMEARQNGDEKKARELFDQEKAIREDYQARVADIEKQIREGKIASPPPLRPDYKLSANRYQIGVKVIPLTEQLAGFFNCAKDSVMITEVVAGELGERHGLKAGDCIVMVAGETVKSASDFNRLVDQKSSGELEFVIVRDRGEQRIKIKLDQK